MKKYSLRYKLLQGRGKIVFFNFWQLKRVTYFSKTNLLLSQFFYFYLFPFRISVLFFVPKCELFFFFFSKPSIFFPYMHNYVIPLLVVILFISKRAFIIFVFISTFVFFCFVWYNTKILKKKNWKTGLENYEHGGIPEEIRARVFSFFLEQHQKTIFKLMDKCVPLFCSFSVLELKLTRF